MKITKEELKSKYGIELPKGKYSIKKDGDNYNVFSVRDDTEGCLLLGENKAKGKVLYSGKTCERVFRKMWLAYNYGSPIWITIK